MKKIGRQVIENQSAEDINDIREVEIKLQNELIGCPVFYFIWLGRVKGKKHGVAYKPGIASDLIQRTTTHRGTFGKHIAAVDAIDLSHLNYREAKMFDSRIKGYIEQMGILYPICGNTETIVYNRPICELVDKIRSMVPRPSGSNKVELARLEIERLGMEIERLGMETELVRLQLKSAKVSSKRSWIPWL
jgi:hypothetical protein